MTINYTGQAFISEAALIYNYDGMGVDADSGVITGLPSFLK